MSLKTKCSTSAQWIVRLLGRATISLLIVGLLLGGKPKKGSDSGEKEATSSDAPVAVALPSDLNEASLRVAAIDTIYQLDLSIAQLHSLRSEAAGAASQRHRKAAKADAKLATSLSELAGALLSSKDDAHVAELRNQVVELSNADSTQLDDDVEPTDKAEKSASQVVHQWTASQIAAFLAFHADQVADPAERMVGALTELHDSAAGGAADATAHEISDEIARMVVGFDEGKAAPLADKIAGWIKANRDQKEEEIATHQAQLEESARKVIGDVSPIDVLDHWLEYEAAILLANPQLPDAADAVVDGKQSADVTK